MLRSLARVFARAGWTCESAPTPLVALDVLGRARMDAVVADYRMQPFDGLELCRRAQHTAFDGPVVIYSGHVTAPLQRRAARAGAWAVVPKDVDAESLAAQLATLCHHCPRLAQPAPLPSIPGGCAAAADAYARVHDLSEQQTRLLECALRDESREHAADCIGCSVGTVHGYWRRICDKTKQRGEHQVLLDVLRFVLARTPRAPARRGDAPDTDRPDGKPRPDG